MNRTAALSRIRSEYLDDDATTDRFEDDILIPWLDEARERLFNSYCFQGGRSFETVQSSTSNAAGLVAIAAGDRIRHVLLPSGESIQRVHRWHATSAYASLAVKVILDVRPGTPSVGTDAVWPTVGALTVDQPGLTRTLEEMLIRETAMYASVKDGSAYTQLREANLLAMKELTMNLQADDSGTANISPQWADGIGWDFAPEQAGILLFRHE